MNLEESLDDSVLIAEFASFVGRQASKPTHTAAFNWYCGQLEGLKSSHCDAWDAKAARRAFKVILAISLLICCHRSANAQEPDEQRPLLESSLIAALHNVKLHKYLTNFILCELSYLDQFLQRYRTREFVYESIKSLRIDFPNSSSFVDYDLGWKFLNQIRDDVLKDEAGEIPSAGTHDKDFQVLLVSSVKGGVGKSTVALALAQYLVDRDNSKVALLDLDASGPTLQYNLNIPDVMDGLSLKPQHSANEPKWPYPTFADAIIDVDRDKPLEAAQLDALLLSGSGHNFNKSDQIAAVLLPDSPTVTTIQVTSKYFNNNEWADILIPLKRLMDHIRAREYKYVVLDLGPGLFGTNGALFSSLMAKYSTSLILMSSPRTFDIASALYEGFWLGAETSLPWQRQILQLLNFWPEEDKDINSRFDALINKYYLSAFDRDFDGVKGDFTSGKSILFWRLRSYLYKLAIEQNAASPIIMRPLQYDKKLRAKLGSNGAGTLDFKNLRESTWYKQDFVPAVKDWLESGDG